MSSPIPRGIRVLDFAMKRNPDFSIEHMDADALARIQAAELPAGRVGRAVVAGLLGARTPGVRVTTTTYPAPHGPVPLRIYTPPPTELVETPKPLIVNIHGGGFSLGSARQGDWLCTRIAYEVDAVVVSVDYRLAPTHRFPAGLEDCYGALLWARDRADRLGGDAARMGIMGDSAGGNLAAVCAVRARDEGIHLAHQALIYPATDLTEAVRGHASYAANTRGIVLSNADLEVFMGHYLPEGTDPADPRLSPIHTPDLSGLPPALVVVAGLDPLHDSGVAYAAALNQAGTPALVEDFHVMPHGFLAFPYFAAGARPAARAIVEAQRAALTRAPLPAEVMT